MRTEIVHFVIDITNTPGETVPGLGPLTLNYAGMLNRLGAVRAHRLLHGERVAGLTPGVFYRIQRARMLPPDGAEPVPMPLDELLGEK